MTTELLYHRDPTLFAFEAAVVEHGDLGGKPTVVLDQTAFYPESGGQMGDRGRLADRPILDVQVDAAGRVHHLLEGEQPAIGERVQGQVDRARRRLFMSLHTAQHLLSRALIETAAAETVSARLGETLCTVDLSVPTIDEAGVARAEELSNAVIEDDLAVRAWFPDPAELASLPLRRAPKVEDKIRIIAIGDFDYSPCGGTHCASTAQIGLLRVLGIERYKGMIRISFDAGRRARSSFAAEAEVLRKLAGAFTCGPLDVPSAIDKLRRELADTKDGARRATERAADEIARALAEKSGVIIEAFDGADKDLLRAIASRLTAEGDRLVVLVAPGAEGAQLLAARGPKSSFDCGALVKRVMQAAGGKGGGRPDRAEGRLPAGFDWRAKLAEEIG